MKIGALATMGKLIYQQKEIYGPSQKLVYEYGGDVVFGVNGGIGFSIKLNKKIALQAELTYTHQLYSPKYGLQIVQVIDGDESESYRNPYQSEMEFGDIQYTPNEDYDINQPQKFYSRNYSLSGYGITLGITYTLSLIHI